MKSLNTNSQYIKNLYLINWVGFDDLDWEQIGRRGLNALGNPDSTYLKQQFYEQSIEICRHIKFSMFTWCSSITLCSYFRVTILVNACH